MQLTKYLQAQGIGSRKQCRQLIEQGRLEINGETAEQPDADIEPAQVQRLAIDGEEIAAIPLPHYYILLHKPAGYETSHKPRDYPSVFSLLPDHIRATEPQAIGRLDADTTGVLLITNDGAFNHRQTSHKHHVAKLYRATLKHPAGEELCAALRQGVLLHDDNEIVAAAAAELENQHSLLLTLTQGKYQLQQSDYHGEPQLLLTIAKTLETHSTHPIAWYYSQQPVATVAMDNIEQHSGKGISGDYDGSRWHIGSAAYMQENGVEIPPTEQPPPPVGEGWGGVYPHTTDADWSLMADKNNVGHKYPTYEENNPLPCEAGEGWGGCVEKSRMATTDNNPSPPLPHRGRERTNRRQHHPRLPRRKLRTARPLPTGRSRTRQPRRHPRPSASALPPRHRQR